MRRCSLRDSPPALFSKPENVGRENVERDLVSAKAGLRAYLGRPPHSEMSRRKRDALRGSGRLERLLPTWKSRRLLRGAAAFFVGPNLSVASMHGAGSAGAVSREAAAEAGEGLLGVARALLDALYPSTQMQSVAVAGGEGVDEILTPFLQERHLRLNGAQAFSDFAHHLLRRPGFFRERRGAGGGSGGA